LKVSTTLTLSCLLVGLAALPSFAQQTTDLTGKTNTPQPLTTTKKTTAAEHGPIRMAPVSVLPASLQSSALTNCQPAVPAGAYLPDKTYGVTIGGFWAFNAPAGIDTDLGFSISVEKMVTVGDKSEVVVNLRYSHYGFTNNITGATGDINLFSPTVGYRYRLGANRRWYLEPNIGLVFTTGRTFSGQSNDTNFAYGIATGYDFQNNLFADLRYVAGGVDSNQGFIFSLGKHF
jgi:hypothetical protein